MAAAVLKQAENCFEKANTSPTPAPPGQLKLLERIAIRGLDAIFHTFGQIKCSMGAPKSDGVTMNDLKPFAQLPVGCE